MAHHCNQGTVSPDLPAALFTATELASLMYACGLLCTQTEDRLYFFADESFSEEGDRARGKAEALKGKVKQAAGDLTDNPDLHDEGVADEAAGDTQATVGQAKRKVGEFVEDLGKNIKK